MKEIKMKNILFSIVVVGLLIFVAAGMVGATLIDKGGGLIYDTEWDMTWLQDANFALTSGYDGAYHIDGQMQWDDAMIWAETLNYQGYSDWRLPTAIKKDGSGPCSGDCSDSEMLHLFFDEGISYISPAPFVNLQSNYWSGTESIPMPISAYSYSSYPGWGVTIKSSFIHAWAVRDGDSSPVPIPEPGTLLLFGSGIAWVFACRRKHGK
jgi:hypothetical protein